MRNRIKRAYVAAMLQVVGRGLAAGSRVDIVLSQELGALPAGFQVQLLVLPAGLSVLLQSNGDGTVNLAREVKAKPDLSIRFKHVSHAFLVLTFQEGTARAFANSRLLADGDLAAATRLLRCLDRLETLILPAFIAKRAVKRPTKIALPAKLALATCIYGVMARQFVFR
ncbi:MAG: hypothetical protein ABL931_23360 [Usitatibacteraceae bacterium]